MAAASVEPPSPGPAATGPKATGPKDWAAGIPSVIQTVVLLAADHVARRSNTPVAKSLVVRFERA